MLSTSTIVILKKLNPDELKKFGDFIKSPYHNKITSLHKIYKIVVKSHPDYTSKDLESEKMSKKIFPSEEFKVKRIQNLCTDFGNLLKKFIGHEEITNRNYELDLHIADGLTKRDLYEISAKFIRKSIAKNDTGLITDAMMLFYNQRINVMQRINLVCIPNPNDDEFEKTESYISDTLITRFIRDVYSEAHSELTHEINRERKRILPEAFLNAFDMNKFLEPLKEVNHKYYSYLKINYLLYNYTKYGITKEQLYDLKKELSQIIHKIDKLESRNFIIRLCEIIQIQLVKSDTKFYRDIFDLGKLFCDLKIYPDDLAEVLDVGSFRDFFLPAINVKEFDWAEKFAIEYTQYLSEEFRENELNYCLGILSFWKGKYEDSLNFLNKLKLTHTLPKISVRFYYVMNYIELKAYESALSAVQTLKQFYNDRKEMPEHFSVTILESLKYFNEIIRCEMEGKKIDGLLYETACTGKNFRHKGYILKKMEKLK